MPCDKIQIAVTSVTAKPDTKPTLCIVNHILLTDKIGNISLYNKLEDIINYLVKDSTYGLFFRNNARHRYAFDGYSIQNGAIYDRGEMRWDDKGDKSTARYLIPIQSESDFKKNIE